ncbi:hypothetical protein DdX_18468 [Ditylenchus destructor]|uniref:F-box domain-containing protein n=1 Tax=Ditylenchus destructor TaxID=166010 RepID=A0AAD4QY30_9BILA|nr:hypothetical protein DdX_18468 [Ditylenchus destructor]
MDQPQLNIPFGLFYNILTCFDRRELCQLRNVNRRHYTVIENKFGTTSPYLVFVKWCLWNFSNIPMDQPQLNIPFGLFYSILTCFDRRELCQLRNVNRRHYTVIERKFGTTPPYLAFDRQYMGMYDWKWQPAPTRFDEMPSEVRDQLPVSKFVRFKSSELLVYHPSESAIDVLSISHVWENQQLLIVFATKFELTEEWACMMATAKYLDVYDGQGSISFLRQFTSGNCVCVILTDWTKTLDTVEHPWNNILGFLFQPNSKDTKSIQISANNPFNGHNVEILDFLHQVKQKFVNFPDSVHFTFAWEILPFTIDGLDATSNQPVFEDFIVQNRRTQQRLRFHSTVREFRLAVEEQD